MNRNIFSLPVAFLVYLFLQVVFFHRLVLFDTAFCLPYIGFILFLPISFSPIVLMLTGFALGFSIDFFQNSQGLHASATIAVAFIRNFWLDRITPQGGYEVAGDQPFGSFGAQWFLFYLIPLLLVHHLILFFVEAGGFSMTGLTLAKAIFSFVFTFVTLFLYRFVLVRR